MTKREVMLAIQAREVMLAIQAFPLNLTEIMQEAQQAWGGDYEQCTEPS